MGKDPIVAEVRAEREAYAKKFGYDSRKIVADLAKKRKVREATKGKTKPTGVSRSKAAKATAQKKRRAA